MNMNMNTVAPQFGARGVKWRELDGALRQNGFELVRNDRHVIYQNAKGQNVTVPNRNHSEIATGTLQEILRQAEKAGVPKAIMRKALNLFA
jgi:predicted RNA binding protein YcfA (HicA-like mRNA interferase family)